MKNYPKDIFEAYTERQIDRDEFVERFSEWQKENGLDYSCKVATDNLEVYFIYRGIAAAIKDNKLLFRTYQNEKANTPFEFQRKVDFYLQQKKQASHKNREVSIMAFDKANDIHEKIVIKQVKEIIEITGIKLQRINTGCFAVGEGRNRRYIRTAEAGTCDFEGYDKCGRFVAIECKRSAGGRLSPAQKKRIEDINRKGGVAFVAHSGDEALALLQANNCI